MWIRDLPFRAATRLGKLAAGTSSFWLMSVAAACLTAICAIVVMMLYSARLDIAKGAETAASNIAQAVTQDEKRNIELLDLSLQAVRDGVHDPDVMALPSKLRREVLFDRAATAKDLGALLVLDREGRVIVDSDADPPRAARFGNSDFFRAHSHSAGTGLFISRPFLSPFDGDWSIALSRRIESEDGSFKGVAVGLMKLAYWDKLFSKLNLGTNGSMSLLGVDGTVFMRHPLDEHDLGRVLDLQQLFPFLKHSYQGTYEATSRVDGIRRVFYYERVGDFPLIQSVAFSVQDLYAPWWHKSAVTLAALTGLCITILGLVASLQVELRRRTAAEAAFAKLAATDKLTGLPNRRKFDEVLDTEWRRANRSQQTIALLLVDVDHFKAYNDSCGHLGGDAVLAGLGPCLQESLRRPEDFAARYGGEEFVVLLPNTDGRGALRMAERIRKMVADLRQPTEAVFAGQVTVSIGIAALLPRSGQPASDLVTLADLALYKAKNSGRNRSVLCRPGQELFAA